MSIFLVPTSILHTTQHKRTDSRYLPLPLPAPRKDHNSLNSPQSNSVHSNFQQTIVNCQKQNPHNLCSFHHKNLTCSDPPINSYSPNSTRFLPLLKLNQLNPQTAPPSLLPTNLSQTRYFNSLSLVLSKKSLCLVNIAF